MTDRNPKGIPAARTALARTVSLYFGDIMGNAVWDVNEQFATQNLSPFGNIFQ
jgi:hypothetical protein